RAVIGKEALGVGGVTDRCREGQKAAFADVLLIVAGGGEGPGHAGTSGQARPKPRGVHRWIARSVPVSVRWRAAGRFPCALLAQAGNSDHASGRAFDRLWAAAGGAFHYIDHAVVRGAAMSHIPHLINGERVAGQGRAADVFNPSTGQVARQVALADRATVQQAIDAAQAAFPAWRNTPPAKRAQLLFRFRNLLEQHKDSIIRLISEEHGKTLEDAAGELQRGIENVEYACGAPSLLKGEYSRNVGPNIDAWSDHYPLGVVAGIT